MQVKGNQDSYCYDLKSRTSTGNYISPPTPISASCRANSMSIGSSKNLLMLTSSLSPFLRRVLTWKKGGRRRKDDDRPVPMRLSAVGRVYHILYYETTKLKSHFPLKVQYFAKFIDRYLTGTDLTLGELISHSTAWP